MAAVSCDGLVVRYGDLVAVDGVSLSVEPGEIYGLLGPNGAGKTSVIRALTTILPPAAGSARVAGHPLADEAAVRAAIGVLPESNGYPGSQTARSYLRFHGQLFGIPRDEADRRAATLLEQLGLAERRGRIGTFSRGMRQRLGLCRALVNRPRVLFLDEPTLGLDPAGQQDILAHLTRVAVEDGAAVVLCSHLLDEVERVCDRIGILHHGRTIVEGRVDDVIAAADLTTRWRICVARDHLHTAIAALEATWPARAITVDNSRPGDLQVAAGDDGANELLRALLEAGVEVHGVEREGARLSDAFLALTDEAVAA